MLSNWLYSIGFTFIREHLLPLHSLRNCKLSQNAQHSTQDDESMQPLHCLMYYAEHWRYECLRSHDDNYKVNVSGNKCSLGNVNPFAWSKDSHQPHHKAIHGWYTVCLDVG